MALALEILLGVMILASFFVAYMSARTWQIYQVVLVVFVFLGTVGFFYLSARTLATHKAWRTVVARSEKELEGAEKRLQEISEGVVDVSGQVNVKGNRHLKADLAKLTTDRGGVLFDVAVDGVKEGGVKEGGVQLTFKSPDHGLVANTVLFAFDQNPADQGGRFQGEFKVASVAEDGASVQLVPNLPLTEAQSQRLAAAKGPWTLYTTMPVDDLAPVAVAQPAAPATPDGSPPAAAPAANPPAANPPVSDAQRKLRDYEFIFHENYVQRSVLADAIKQVLSNIERTDAALKHANEEIAYRKDEKTNLAADLEKFRYELKAIAAYQQSVEKLFASLRDSLKRTYADTRQKASELTAAQLQAAEEINQRTQAAQANAQSNTAAAAIP